MADDDQLDRRVRRPEPIDLPALSGTVGIPQSAPPKAPFFLSLAAQRSAYFAGFEALRDNDRRQRIKNLQSQRDSRVVVYYSVGLLTPRHAELLHDLLEMRPPAKNLDLYLLSPGGYAEAGHKMAILCREHATESFRVLIPYYAKSAATLLCLGADTLVMGPASEIGPIDPRIRVPDQYGRLINISATSVRDALDMLEKRAKGSPEMAVLYTPLLEKVDINVIGEYERALKSSEQIARALLEQYMLKKDKRKARRIGTRLSRQYYSHGYSIDRLEARDSLGLNVLDATATEWETMWQLHKLYAAMIDESGLDRQVEAVFETEDMKFLEFSRPSQTQPTPSRGVADGD